MNAVDNIIQLFNDNNNDVDEESEDSVDAESIEDVEIEQMYYRELRIRRAELRAQYNPFVHLHPRFFRKHYRMSKQLARQLLDLIYDDFNDAVRESHVEVEIEFLTALRMFASGGYQTTIGQDSFHNVSQPTVSRVLDRFIDSVFGLADRFIFLPQTREERLEIQAGFQHFTRIPGIIGLIDGTIIKFLRPTEHEEAYYNYNHKHSMNVQLIGDHNFVIRNVRVCPGSNTDRNVWNHSDAKDYLESLRRNEDILLDEMAYYLIGDNGYSPSPIMLTPIRRAAAGTPEYIYTNEICQTRSREEQLHSKLVNKWRILKRERALRYRPVKVARIITVAAVLHNFVLMNGHGRNGNEIDDDDNEDQRIGGMNINFDYNAGIEERNYVIRTYYHH